MLIVFLFFFHCTEQQTWPGLDDCFYEEMEPIQQNALHTGESPQTGSL